MTYLLPSIKKLGGSLLQRFSDGKNRHRFRNRDELDLPPQKNPEAPSSPSSYRPKPVLSHGFSVQNPPIRVHDLRVHHVVSSQPILPHHRTISPSGNVPSDTQARAQPRREAVDGALLRDSVIHLADGGARLNPRSVLFDVHVNGSKFGEVYDYEGGLDF